MKHILKQLGLLTLIAGIALVVATASARQQTPAPGGFPNNNAPTPVNTGTQRDIKGVDDLTTSGGGLSVEAFTAYKNASFFKLVNLQGILTGGENSGVDSSLAFGDSTREVDLTVKGSIYAQDGALYTIANASEPGQQKALCADNDGWIIECPSAQQVTGTLSLTKQIVGQNDNDIILKVNVPSFNTLTVGATTTFITAQIPKGTYSFTAQCQFDPTRVSSQWNGVQPTVTQPSGTFTIEQGDSTALTIGCECDKDSGGNCR